MKKVAVLVALVFSASLYAEPGPTFGYKPSFSAVVVKDVITASAWYCSVFDMKVKEEMKDGAGAYSIHILESPDFLMELLQLRGSVDKQSALAGKPNGTEIQGHFKIGFKVTDVDACLKKLASLNIDVPQVWTDQKTKKRNFLIKDPDGNLIQFFE